MDAKKRQRLSWLGSIAFHIIAALIIGLTGLLHFSSLDNSDIFEVQAVDHGGSSGGGGDSASEPVDDSTPAAASNSEQEAFTPEQLGSDAILEHSDTSKTNVTYAQLDELQQKEEQQQQNQTADSASISAVSNSSSRVSSNTNTGSNGNNAVGTNTSTDEGTGNGSGSNGTGEGTGNDNGQGDGNCNGQDIGEATDEIVSNPAQTPSRLSSGRPNYPQSAIQAGIEGTVVIRFLVGKDGSVESAEIAASSGHSELDAAAMATAYNWSFSPARDEYGRPVRCYVRIPIPFRLR